MRGPLGNSLAFLLLLLPLAGAAYGDALCNHDDSTLMESRLRKGRSAERAGRALEAILYYKAIDDFCGNGDEARKGIMRVGAKMAERAASQGRLRAGAGIFNLAADEDCRRWARYFYLVPNPYEPPVPGLCAQASTGGMRIELSETAGAYEWYEATRNYREADSVMLKLALASPGELAVFDLTHRHFMGRHKLREPGYSPDPGHISRLVEIAASNAASILSREGKEYAGKRSADTSIAMLDAAMRWASYGGPSSQKKVTDRALERAAESLLGTRLSDMHSALEFYAFAGDTDKLALVALRADELGAGALGAGDPQLAIKFFTLSGNRAMVEKTMPLAEKARKSSGAKSRTSPQPPM